MDPDIEPDRLCIYVGFGCVTATAPTQLVLADCLNTKPLFSWCHRKCWVKANDQAPLYDETSALKVLFAMRNKPFRDWPRPIFLFYFKGTGCRASAHKLVASRLPADSQTLEDFRRLWESRF